MIPNELLAVLKKSGEALAGKLRTKSKQAQLKILQQCDELLRIFTKGRQAIQEFFTKLTDDIGAWLLKNRKNKSIPDDLIENVEDLRKLALRRWFQKFDANFINHLSGDVEIINITKQLGKKLEGPWLRSKDWLYIGVQGEGGYWLNKFLTVDKITFPPGVSKVWQLADNVPFKARVTIKSLKGKKFVKLEESSMFPKNWSLERIQEEIALVYENTVMRGRGQLPKKANDLFIKFQFKSTKEFDILLEVDDLDYIINAYPIIK